MAAGMQFTLARDTESLQAALAALMEAGRTVALVPTMGALHDGHGALLRHARTLADAVVVSVFVNPRQFGPGEDFARYPRMLEADAARARDAGAALVYAPGLDDMYPAGFSAAVSPGPLGQILEGRFRPGHFNGVATVVTKLLLRVLPHVAVFGEKDYQQLCVIRRVVDDLDLGIEIEGFSTVREADGLAMSSRNGYLSPQERAVAPKLHETLRRVRDAIVAGTAVQPSIDQGIAALTRAGFAVDYLEMREEDTLAELDGYTAPARLLVAAKLGRTRLIDNIALEEEGA